MCVVDVGVFILNEECVFMLCEDGFCMCYVGLY